MRLTIRGFMLSLAWLGCAIGAEVHAQVPVQERPSQARELAEVIRSGAPGIIVPILTEPDSPYSRAELDALADTLAALAISLSARDHDDPPGVRTRNTTRASDLVRALRWAGAGESSYIPEGGTPYAGAADRLLRIAEAGVYVSPGAVRGLTRLPDRGQALEYLRRVATQDTYAAGAAVEALAREMGPEGLAILRELHQQGAVVHLVAQEHLRRIAWSNGWR